MFQRGKLSMYFPSSLQLLLLLIVLPVPMHAQSSKEETNPIFIQVKTGQRPRPVMDRATIESGLREHNRALYIKAGWIRDPYITLGPDDLFYLTGTQPNRGDPREAEDPYNLGLGVHSLVGTQVRVWRSVDLIDWEEIPIPFTLSTDSWHKDPGDRIWAPEVHWLEDHQRWALIHCPARKANFVLSPGPDLKGPWSHPMGDALGSKHDPSLYRAANTWWMLWGNTQVAPLSPDLTQFTAGPVRIDPAGSRPGPNGEPISHIGHEGATMIRVDGKFVHFGTAWSTDTMRKGSYNLYYCVSENIDGPYGPRKFAGRFLGHGTPFQDRSGRWWCTAFFNANLPPLPREGIQGRDLSENAQTINEQGVTIVPLDVRVLPDGEIFIRAKDPAYARPGPDESVKFFK
jgi:hypothetical protein